MVPVFLFFAGICLTVNGVWLYQGTKIPADHLIIAGKDVAILNIFTGSLGVAIISLSLAAGAFDVDESSFSSAAYVGLFAATFLWNGVNQFTNVNSSGLGWYCLPVAVLAAYIGIYTFPDAVTLFDYWLAVSWLTWAILWLAFYLTMGLKLPTTRFTSYLCFLLGPLSLTLPGLLVLSGAIS